MAKVPTTPILASPERAGWQSDPAFRRYDRMNHSAPAADFPLGCQHQAARDADKQLAIQMLLQRLNVLADGGMGDVQLYRGMRKTEVPGGRFEGAKRIKRKIAAGHCSIR